MRKVRTASGAVAVQVVTKEGRAVVDVDHVGSAHSNADLALLMQAAHERLSPGQDALDLGPVDQLAQRVDDVADWTGQRRLDGGQRPARRGRPAQVAGGGQVVSTASLLLWSVLADAYYHLGFDVLADETFKALVLARIIEPTSKIDSIRVLNEIGVSAPGSATIYRCLGRCQERDYRGTLAHAALAHSARVAGTSALIMYDVTTLHFETPDEDELRRVGMSKEHRIDPQIQVGLLVDAAGFPLEVHMFEGNTAETKTILPVLDNFRSRHGLVDLVVVADAGMLSAGNLNAIEDAGYSFIVGSRLTTAPYDLAEHFEAHGTYFDDGQILESARTMGSRSDARQRRVVYQWTFKRQKRDDRNINKMVERAEKIADGQAPLKRTRFLKVTGADKQLDQARIDRARQLAGLKGYVTNIPIETMNGSAVIGAYHDLWEVEASFRLTKSDLAARPVFHRTREAIEAHLTVVFAALAVTRHLQRQSGTTIRKIVHTLRPVQSARVEINGQEIDIEPKIPHEAQNLLNAIRGH